MEVPSTSAPPDSHRPPPPRLERKGGGGSTRPCWAIDSIPPFRSGNTRAGVLAPEVNRHNILCPSSPCPGVSYDTPDRGKGTFYNASFLLLLRQVRDSRPPRKQIEWQRTRRTPLNPPRSNDPINLATGWLPWLFRRPERQGTVPVHACHLVVEQERLLRGRWGWEH